MDLFVLTFIISDLILHSSFFIETHSKEFTFHGLKLKNVFAVKNIFNESKDLYYMPFFSIRYL